MRTIAFAGIALLLAGCGFFACAADEKHPIDRAYEACIDKNPSTAGMVECADKAAKKWDAELNRVYAELLKRLPAERGGELKRAQREWLAFRDAEFRWIERLYGSLDGTMYISASADAHMRVIRERALALTQYLELISEAGR